MAPSLTELESQRDSLAQTPPHSGGLPPRVHLLYPGALRQARLPLPPAPGQPAHGPHWRLTYKRHGKTVSESLSDEAARQKAEREIAAYREFQQLTRQVLDVNFAICRQRSTGAEDDSGPLKKNGAGDPGRGRSGGRTLPEGDRHGPAQERGIRPGSPGAGDPRGDAASGRPPCWRRCWARTRSRNRPGRVAARAGQGRSVRGRVPSSLSPCSPRL